MADPIYIAAGAVFVAFLTYFMLRTTAHPAPKSKPSSVAAETKPKRTIRTDYTKEEVAKHNTKTDLWIIVSDKVYDITEYVDDHPGGDLILNQAGGDNTEIMAAPQHPVSVYDVLATYYIGDLKK